MKDKNRLKYNIKIIDLKINNFIYQLNNKGFC